MKGKVKESTKLWIDLLKNLVHLYLSNCFLYVQAQKNMTVLLKCLLL